MFPGELPQCLGEFTEFHRVLGQSLYLETSINWLLAIQEGLSTVITILQGLVRRYAKRAHASPYEQFVSRCQTYEPQGFQYTTKTLQAWRKRKFIKCSGRYPQREEVILVTLFVDHRVSVGESNWSLLTEVTTLHSLVCICVKFNNVSVNVTRWVIKWVLLELLIYLIWHGGIRRTVMFLQILRARARWTFRIILYLEVRNDTHDVTS